MKILSIGNCPICQKQIYKFNKPPLFSKSQYGWTINFKSRPYALNDDGAFLWLLLTDSSRMNVSICKDCLSKITDEQVNNIYADVTYTKLKAIEKDRRKDLHYRLFNRIRTIEVYEWALSEVELIAFLGNRNLTMKEECQKT